MLDSLQSATPSVSKQFSASWSMGCGSKLRLLLVLVSKYEALSLVSLCSSVGQTKGRGCH